MSIVGAIDGRKVVLVLGALLLFGAAGMLRGHGLHGQGLPKEPSVTPGPLRYPNPSSNPASADSFPKLTSVASQNPDLPGAWSCPQSS